MKVNTGARYAFGVDVSTSIGHTRIRRPLSNVVIQDLTPILSPSPIHIKPHDRQDTNQQIPGEFVSEVHCRRGKMLHALPESPKSPLCGIPLGFYR